MTLADSLRVEFPFAPRYLTVGGFRYHHVDERPPVDAVRHGPLLFVHGNPTWSFAWRHLIRRFSPQRRCIAVDHIGCGKSDKPQKYAYRLAQHVANLCELITALDLRDITLVAHDWGGCIGMGAAVRMPERFSRFVLMNTAAFRSQRIPLRIAVCRIPVLGPLGVRGCNLFARAATHMAVERAMPADVKAGYLVPYDSWANRIAIQRFVEDIPLQPSHPSYGDLVAIEDDLPNVADRPMLLAWGMRDWCFTPDFLREWRERFPNAEVVEFASAGHYVFEDAREELGDRIARFVCV